MANIQKDIEEEEVPVGEAEFMAPFGINVATKALASSQGSQDGNGQKGEAKGEAKGNDQGTAQAEFDKCKEDTTRLLNKLANSVKILKDANAHGVAEHERKLTELQSRYTKIETLGQTDPTQARQQMEANVKAGAIGGVKSVAKDAAAVHLQKIQQQQKNKELGETTCNKLLGMYTAAKEPVDFAKFIDAVDQELVARDTAKIRWDKVDKQMLPGLKTAADFQKLFAASGDAKSAQNCQSVVKKFEEAMASGQAVEFKIAAYYGESALNSLTWMQPTYDNHISTGGVGSLVAEGMSQAGLLMKTGQQKKYQWLVDEARKCVTGFQDAIKTKSNDAAKKPLNEFVVLQNRWEDEQKAKADWDEGAPKREQNMALAQFLIPECKTRSRDDLSKGAQTYLDEVKLPLKSASAGEFVKANSEYKTPGLKFTGIRDKFNDLQKPELKKDFDARAGDPNSVEAQVQDALKGSVTGTISRLVTVTNATNAAKTQGVKVPKLSPGEAVAIFSYTTGDYEPMNRMLIGIDKPDAETKRKLDLLVKATTAALEKLPPYDDNTPTNRGEKPWPDADKQYTVGKKFTIKGFWSTGIGFKFPGTYQITITRKAKKPPKGKNIQAFSEYVHEKEVVFPPGTKFRVIGRKDVSKDVIQIAVEQR